jgi:hypothetical protein
MGRVPKTASELTPPLQEAWEELQGAYRTVEQVSRDDGK